MNEKVPKGQEMAGSQKDIRKIIETIMDNTLKTRPQCEPYYLPYKKVRGIGHQKALGSLEVDLNQFFPDAADGDVAFVDFNITTGVDYDIYLNLRGNVKAYFEGKHVFTCFEDTPDREIPFIFDLFLVPVSVKAGRENRVRLKCVKHGNDFGAKINITVRRYPSMWANDYLYAARATSPVAEYHMEDGAAVTELVHTGKKGLEALNADTAPGEGYVFPAPSTQKSFNFNSLCGEGDVCYVYTEAAETHTVSWTGTVDAVWVNGQKREAGPVAANAGDKLLFRCVRQDEDWSFAVEDEKLVLPFLKSNRVCGDKAVFVGPFFGKMVHAPEFEWDFSKVFMNTKGEKLYWRFCDGSQLRIYLDSVFYGQWFYALMVGFYGIRRAAQTLGDEARQHLFCENMSFIAKYFDYIQYEIAANKMPPFMPRTEEIDVLDNIGTMGMNFVDAYLDSNDENILPLIELLSRQADNAVPRMEDGTYYRVETMWADDLYMSCPFLVRMGKLTGKSEWYEKAIKQVKGFAERLYIEDENLFSHIYFPPTGLANKVPWGRGDGWVMWTLTEILLHAEDKVDTSWILELFQKMADALKRLQSPGGLWRQVLNREEEASYPETSCTAMFLLAFARGVKNGWLDGSYLPAIRSAWNGLMNSSVDREGNVYGVCMGSGCAMEAEYYFDIPTIKNDDHGTGVVLAAASELYDLEQLGYVI